MDFEEIYITYFRDIYLFILAMSKDAQIAEEITQETFFKVLKEVDNFKGTCSVKSWLCQIARNLYIDDFRRRKKFQEAREKLSDGSREGEGTETAVVRREEVISIYKALHCLDEPYKEVFSLRMLGELTYKEIGDIFDKSESWARVTYHRAKLKIRDYIM